MDASRNRQSGLPTIHAPADGSSANPWLPRQIRGVLLDMGNVLYDDALWQQWVRQLLAHLGLHNDCRGFPRVWDRDYVDDVHRGRCGFGEAFRAFLSSVGLSQSQIDEVEGACRGRRRLLETGMRPLPGVKTTLERLHQSGLALGAIDNSEYPACVLRQRLDQFAVGGLFATVVSSIDIERTMPDPTGYLTALRAMDLPAGRVAFVGHDTAELAGAAEVGMPTIALNFDCDARADVYLARFEELLDVLCPQLPLAAAG